MKEGGGFVSCFFRVQGHAGERGIAQFAEQLVVIHANDRHFVGNPQAAFLMPVPPQARMVGRVWTRSPGMMCSPHGP